MKKIECIGLGDSLDGVDGEEGRVLVIGLMVIIITRPQNTEVGFGLTSTRMLFP